jgi:hypothetical protein
MSYRAGDVTFRNIETYCDIWCKNIHVDGDTYSQFRHVRINETTESTDTTETTTGRVLSSFL